MKIKKLTTAAITGMMVLGMATGVCSAATTTITDPDTPATQEVQASYTTDGKAAIVHSVDIEWGALEYTYNIPSEGRWDPTSHEFVEADTEGTWNCASGADKIKVTNHSNTAVKAVFSYEKGQEYGSITGTFDVAEAPLKTAEGTEYNDAPEATATLSLDGALNKSVTEATTIGTVTVSLGDVQ